MLVAEPFTTAPCNCGGELSDRDQPPDEINVVGKIPKGSKIKYEIDPKSRGISVDRTLFPAFFITMALFLKQKKKVVTIQLMYSYLEILLYCPRR